MSIGPERAVAALKVLHVLRSRLSGVEHVFRFYIAHPASRAGAGRVDYEEIEEIRLGGALEPVQLVLIGRVGGVPCISNGLARAAEFVQQMRLRLFPMEVENAGQQIDLARAVQEKRGMLIAGCGPRGHAEDFSRELVLAGKEQGEIQLASDTGEVLDYSIE